MRAGTNSVILEYPKPIGFDNFGVLVKDEIDFSENHLKNYAKVVGVPGKHYWCGFDGKRSLSLRERFLYDVGLEYCVPMEVSEGDSVLFKHSSLYLEDEDPVIDGKLIVRYDNLIARIDSENALYPLNGYVLIEMQDRSDTLRFDVGYSMNSGIVAFEGKPLLGIKGSPDRIDWGDPIVGKKIYFERKRVFRIEMDDRNSFGGQYPLYAIHRKWIKGWD